MVNIGDSVLVDPNEYEGIVADETGQEVADIAYLDVNFEYCSAQSGELHYLVPSKDRSVWVKAKHCEPVTTSSESFFDQDARSPQLEELGYSMVAWKDGLEERPDNSNLPPVVTMLMAIQYDKEGQYGSSWKGRGEYRGIMSNIDRKYDRLDHLTQLEIEDAMKSLQELENDLKMKEIDPSDVPESKIDAIADLANYCLLYMTYVREKYPMVFDVWVKKNVPSYLAEKIPFV
jgi:hypothetical protein